MTKRFSTLAALLCMGLTACQDIEKDNDIDEGETAPMTDEGQRPDEDNEGLDCEELEAYAERLEADCEAGNEEACLTLREMYETLEDCEDDDDDDDDDDREEDSEDEGEDCERLSQLAEQLWVDCVDGDTAACNELDEILSALEDCEDEGEGDWEDGEGEDDWEHGEGEGDWEHGEGEGDWEDGEGEGDWEEENTCEQLAEDCINAGVDPTICEAAYEDCVSNQSCEAAFQECYATTGDLEGCYTEYEVCQANSSSGT